jgi:hypothetical protein
VISSPFRRSDLVHSDNAFTVRVEELLAHQAIPFDKIIPGPGGVVISGSSLRVDELWPTRNSKRYLWVDSAQIDSFGTTWMRTRRAPHFTALCAWPEADSALRHLQRDFIGPALWDIHRSSIIEVVLEELCDRFGFVARPLNSAELPAIARLDWGYLIQLTGNELAGVREYFLLGPSQYDVPIFHHLGAHLVMVLAITPDRIKIALCFDGAERPVIQIFYNWLLEQQESAVVTTP